MAHVIEWIEGKEENIWWMRVPYQWGEQGSERFMVTVGSVTYRPDERIYAALFVPTFMAPAWESQVQEAGKFDSLEEAQAWMMVLARMG